jgi:(heptosyl)LPS beta-1,4-glucosyltransferase
LTPLTVTLVTLDDEARLPRLVASLQGLAAELVAVDLGSRDGTVELLRAAGAVVLESPWPSAREQRALALGHASGDYVLDLRPDEWLSPELRASVRAELERPGGPAHAGYRLHLRHRALGGRIRFGQAWLDHRVRLFRRAGAR